MWLSLKLLVTRYVRLPMFKSQEKLIAEIHNEFDTAQDRLLSQAVSILNAPIPTESKVEKVADRLVSVGFTNTPTVKKASQLKEARKATESVLVKTKEDACMIQYYKQTYPFLKFLTVEELDRICDKYSLIHAPVARYQREVPEKNLRDIENAQKLRREDTCENLYRFFLSFAGEKDSSKQFLTALGKIEPVFTRDELYDLVVKFYGKHGADMWVPQNMDHFRTTTFWIISGQLPGVKQSSYYESFETVDKSGLFIAAPETHFDLTGLSKKTKNGFFEVFKTEVKDPIVFRYVKGGIQVLTKWGLEAEDPSLIIDINN